MLFVELRFMLFFAAVFAGHWLLRRNHWRKAWLLAASYLFYGAWDWRFLSLIALSTGLDYTVGLLLGGCRGPRFRRALLAVSVVGNLGMLGVFKYYNFFAESAAGLAAVLGVPLSPAVLDVVLPVGISFYTFQTLSYSIDVYRGTQAPARNPLDVALFVAFFPQLVAGPIVRSRDFLPQLQQHRHWRDVDVQGCVLLFLVGFFKKICVSDHLAQTVDTYFADPQAFSAVSAWMAVLAYAVQIYCDFSGYSDMAIACAGLLGYRLCVNFAHPYFAGSITEFWRRWHISLSTWLRDYLYIPLGGSRAGASRTVRNLMLTMALGGLWHGASWNFVIWGLLHGAALVAHKVYRQVLGDGRLAVVLQPLGPAVTFYWVCVAWIFFRATDLATAGTVFKGFVLCQSQGPRQLDLGSVAWLPVLVLLHYAALHNWFRKSLGRLPDWAFAGASSLAVFLMVGLAHSDYRPFIYFQF